MTKSFELTVRGSGFTEENRIYVNGNPLVVKTKFVSSSELKADFPQHLFTSPGQFRIEVKTPGKEEEWFSIPLNLTVLQPPSPNYKMLAYIAEANGANPQALLQDGNKTLTVVVGQRLGIFTITSITPQTVEFEDIATAVGVKHTIRLPENPNSGSSVSSSLPYQPIYQTEYIPVATASSAPEANPQLQEYDTGDYKHEATPIDPRQIEENRRRFREIIQQRRLMGGQSQGVILERIQN